MKLSKQACVDFEHDISLFVDHELEESGVGRLVEHIDHCEDCRDYVDDLREMSSLITTSANEADEAIAGLVDRHELFASVTRRLVEDKLNELSRLFYELGKACVLAGNKAVGGIAVVPARQPVDIAHATDHARRVAREGEMLETEARRSGSLFRRSRTLLRGTPRAGTGTLAKGRRFLQESLTLRPELDEARLYLGFLHLLTGRADRARMEFRRVYRRAKDPVHRMMALQFLGNIHSADGDYSRGIECYEEVVKSGLVDTAPVLFPSLLNLAVTYAKVGLVDRSVAWFNELVERFPAKVAQVRGLLDNMSTFNNLLRRRSELEEELRRRVPALFAARCGA